MNAELKATWLAALRSGDFIQTTGALERPIGANMAHCCLGVLNVVRGAAKENDSSCHSAYPHLDALLAAPGETEGFVDNGVTDVSVPSGAKLRARCANANDGAGEFVGNPHTFAQIADLLEAELITAEETA